LTGRPFYTAPRGADGAAANSFDLLFGGVEITTRGPKAAPSGGFAIGLERLTAQILELPNLRQAMLYPRDRHKLPP